MTNKSIINTACLVSLLLLLPSMNRHSMSSCQGNGTSTKILTCADFILSQQTLAPMDFLGRTLSYETDFDINQPVLFTNSENTFSPDDLESALKLLNPDALKVKINTKTLMRARDQIGSDFKRLKENLKTLGIADEEVLFVTLGNSMESYGYVLKEQNPGNLFHHVKISRTTLTTTSTEDVIGYLKQEMVEAIGKNSKIRYTVFIDTFDRGESYDSIMAPLVQAAIQINQMKTLIPACLLEGGSMGPKGNYSTSLDIVHAPDLDKGYLSRLNAYAQRRQGADKLPIMTFNAYSTQKELEAQNGKRVAMILETQQIPGRDLYVIPGNTQGILSPINPYAQTGQKTVEIVRSRQNKFIPRDGFGSSRQEKVPERLHQLNRVPSFRALSLTEKVKLVILKDQTLLEAAESRVRDIIEAMTAQDMELARMALISFARALILKTALKEYAALLRSSEPDSGISLPSREISCAV